MRSFFLHIFRFLGRILLPDSRSRGIWGIAQDYQEDIASSERLERNLRVRGRKRAQRRKLEEELAAQEKNSKPAGAD